MQEVDRGVNIWSLHAIRPPRAERDPERRAEALKVLQARFGVLDRTFEGRPYLLGNTFTVADLNLGIRSSAAPSTWSSRKPRTFRNGSGAASP